MDPDELKKLFEKTLKQIIDEKNLSSDQLEHLFDKPTDKVLEISDEIANVLFKSLLKNSRSMLRKRRRDFKKFEKRHYKKWKKGIDLLESFLALTYEIGENFNEYYREEAAMSQDYLFDALTRLHARSVHIGHEVLSLLCSGFADGAHARWRTAHEIAVVANFLANHDREVAKMYLEHEVIESYRAVIQYQIHAEYLGYEKISSQEISDIKKVRDKLCSQYGKSFNNQYGWAAKALGVLNPKLPDIEKVAELDHYRPYYKMASHNIHANPKGIRFRLGLSDGADILIAGPSNYGLADPAHEIALSILQTTVCLLNLKENIDAIVKGKILLKFADAIGEAFIEIHDKMQNSE